MGILKDETGKRYGRLLVIERHDPAKHGPYYLTTQNALWVCRCDCGETTVVMGCNLRRGLVKSCGCLRREATGERFRKKA